MRHSTSLMSRFLEQAFSSSVLLPEFVEFDAVSSYIGTGHTQFLWQTRSSQVRMDNSGDTTVLKSILNMPPYKGLVWVETSNPK